MLPARQPRSLLSVSRSAVTLEHCLCGGGFIFSANCRKQGVVLRLSTHAVTNVLTSTGAVMDVVHVRLPNLTGTSNVFLPKVRS